MDAIIELQGNVLRWRVGHIPQHNDRPPARVEGDIRGWSSRSRKRLLDVLNTMVIPDNANAYFGSLTYHELQQDVKVVAKNWSAYRKFLIRRGLSGVWVRELQKRKAIHIHFLAFSFSPVDTRELESHWTRIVDDDDRFLKIYGAKVLTVDAGSRMVGYVAKYVTKSDDDFPGRKWGVFGQVIQAQKEVYVVDEGVVEYLKAMFQEAALGWSEYKQGVSVRGLVYCGELGSRENRFAGALENYIDARIAAGTG